MFCEPFSEEHAQGNEQFAALFGLEKCFFVRGETARATVFLCRIA